MLKRLYIHNYKAFQNFEISLNDFGSILCLGKNGVGKSSLVEVFRLFQQIGEGESQLFTLFEKDDFNFLQPETPMKLEMDVELSNNFFQYSLMVDFPKGFDCARVIKEQLTINSIKVLDRNEGDVIYRSIDNKEIADFFLDWHMIALPIFNPRKQELDSIKEFKDWLYNIVVLSPIPAFMDKGISGKLPMKPNYFVDNLNIWVTKLFSEKPRSYQYMFEYLKSIFHDLEEIDNRSEKLSFKFRNQSQEKELSFSQLSYGERIFVLWSAVLASVKLEQISICVWDEPDNYISLLEIQYFFHSFKKEFKNKALFFSTTHNPEAMRMFSSDEVFILTRENHLVPIRLQMVSELNLKDDIVEVIKAGLIEL